MAIQWFPGHMNVTKKAIAERIKDIDVVIELLDARLPGSSANPMLAALTGQRHKLKVLNKQDLADPARTEAWLAWYRAQAATGAIGLDASETAGYIAHRLHIAGANGAPLFTPEALGNYLKLEVARWAKVVKEAGVKQGE